HHSKAAERCAWDGTPVCRHGLFRCQEWGSVMTISASTLRLLLQAGLEGEALIEVVESMEKDHGSDKPRSSAAIRQERYRQKKASQNVTSDVTSDVTAKGTLDREG